MLNRAKDEIAMRGFSDIPTDKLVALILKTSSAIKDGEQQVVNGEREFGLFELSYDRKWLV